MSVLEVAGARLYYEVRGEGPLLVLVPGAKGEAGVYQDLAHDLSGRYRVVTYDRRGFSRSELVGPQDYDNRLATDTEDVRSLITRLTDRPATVFGNSSGAIVALEVLIHYPKLVLTVVAHETPAVKLLPDAAKWLDFFEDVYATYRTSGIPDAMRKYATIFSEVDRETMGLAKDPSNDEYFLTNTTYWMEHELRQYPRVELDVDTLAAHADQLILAGGRESRGHLPYLPNEALAKSLGLDILELPGGHIGCVARHAEFAAELTNALATDRTSRSRVSADAAGRDTTRSREETRMANRPPHPSTKYNGVGPPADKLPSTPRWVKVFVIVGVVLVLLLVIMLLTGHGPGSHMGSHALSAGAAERGV